MGMMKTKQCKLKLSLMNIQGRVKSMAVSEFDVYVFLSLISGTISTLKLLVMQNVYSLKLYLLHDIYSVNE